MSGLKKFALIYERLRQVDQADIEKYIVEIRTNVATLVAQLPDALRRVELLEQAQQSALDRMEKQRLDALDSLNKAKADYRAKFEKLDEKKEQTSWNVRHLFFAAAPGWIAALIAFYQLLK